MNHQNLNNSILEQDSIIKNTSFLNNNSDFKDILEINSKFNKKLSNISHVVSPESVLFTMIKLIVDHRNQIAITDSVLSINAGDLDLVHKLNYCMEYLTNIPFSFQYSKLQSKILLNFLYLKKEMDVISNLEI